MPNKISHFWQDLKRRNVVRVITVYAGAAFVIIELINNITEPLRLPEWTPTLVIILLLIGFPVVIIFSWIYDMHPEGGLVKTKTVDKVKPEDIPKSSNGWKIASYISFVVIIALIILNILPRSGNKENLEKSIAVLPFINESSDEENTYFINGIMESILDNLSRIEDLQVRGRTSVEQYRNNPKPIPTVAEEMNVSYVLEGSGQKIGNRILLTVQLIIGKDDDHIWSRQYDRRIQKVEDLIDLQKEIAQYVANEIEAAITPEEKQLIEKAPTTSLMANELYQRGRDEYIKFLLLNLKGRDALNRAQDYYLRALEEDPDYAKACAGMAMALYSKLAAQGQNDFIYFDGYLEDNAFDTVFFWANRALQMDNQLPEAYYIRGNYYYQIGNWEKAEQDYHEAIQHNPNYWEAYYGIGYMYYSVDFIKTFQYFQKAKSLVRGPELSYILSSILQSLTFSGNVEQAEPFMMDIMNLTQDSLYYYSSRAFAEFLKGNVGNVHHWITKGYAYDSTNPFVLSALADSYINMGNFEKGLEYYKRSEEINHRLKRIDHQRLRQIGYAYFLDGKKEEADNYFDRQVEICKSLIRLNRPLAQIGLAQYDLAAIYAFRGEKSKAMDILRDLHQRSNLSYGVNWLIQTDPMLDGIRDDPDFQQINNDLSIKFLSEVNKFSQWLEENEML